MSRRRLLLLVPVLAGVLVLLAGPAAVAAGDLYGNIGPGQTFSGIAGRYPLGNYVLDQHFDAVSASLTGGVDASGIPPMIAYFLANLIWQITAFTANAVITLFTFAFSLDLLNGSTSTGGAGALQPVSAAIQGIYAHTFGQAWMVAGIAVAGCWAMWKALVQRRYTETAGALALSLVFCVIALAIVTRPAETIGQASTWTNRISTSFLSITTSGDVTSDVKAKQSTADSLFQLLIYEPWAALDFGGTEHCVKTATGSNDHDPDSTSVRPLAAAARGRLDAGQTVITAGKTCVNNTARYAAHFLRYAGGSGDRGDEYDAVNDADPGKLPKTDSSTGYRPGVADKPAVDAMEKGGQYQRLLLALVILVGELGVFLLLGALSISVVIAQVLLLLFVCFAPVALVLGVIPGRGHDFFRGWLARLGSLLLRKAAYSLVLAVLLAVMAALQSAASGLGWLMAFGLQAALAWTVFVQRKQLTGSLTSVATGAGSGREDDALARVLSLYYGSRVVTGAARRLRHNTQAQVHPSEQDAVEPSGPLPVDQSGPDAAATEAAGFEDGRREPAAVHADENHPPSPNAFSSDATRTADDTDGAASPTSTPDPPEEGTGAVPTSPAVAERSRARTREADPATPDPRSATVAADHDQHHARGTGAPRTADDEAPDPPSAPTHEERSLLDDLRPARQDPPPSPEQPVDEPLPPPRQAAAPDVIDDGREAGS